MKENLKIGWRVEAFTPMGILAYEPIHKTREEAEKHKVSLEKKNHGMSFEVIEEKIREERNNALC